MDKIVKAFLAAVLVFLYLPIAVMVVMAFNRSALYELPFTFDLIWFKSLLSNERLMQASWNSVWIATVNAMIATLLGTLAAYAFARFEFRAKRLLQLLLFPPITIPWLIIGTSMLIFFFWTGIGRGLHAILLGHVALSLPYVIVVVGARFATFGPELEGQAYAYSKAGGRVSGERLSGDYSLVQYPRRRSDLAPASVLVRVAVKSSPSRPFST